MGENPEAFSSQFGEDRFLVEQKLVPTSGVFVDVGAGDPVRFSNTYYLEQLGWEGVCIDADPRQIEALTRQRTCAVEWAAVTAEVGEVEFVECEDPDYSTTLDHLPGLAAKSGWEYALTCVPAVRLETILENHSIETINLLSIDTEGSELDVCDTLDWGKHRPRVVVIEYLTWGRPSQEQAIRDYFAELPYRLVHRTTSNLIFNETRARRLLGRHPSLRAHLMKRDEKLFPPGAEIDYVGEGPAPGSPAQPSPSDGRDDNLEAQTEHIQHRRSECRVASTVPRNPRKPRLKPWPQR